MLKDEYKIYEDKMKKSIESVANDFADEFLRLNGKNAD